MELVHLPVLHRCVAQSDTASTFGRSGLTRSNIRAAIESAQVSSANGINMSADDAQPAVAAPVERPQLLSGTSLATCAQSGEGEKCRAPSRGRGAGAERGTGRDPMSLVVKAAGQGSATGPERQTAPLPLAASCAEFATSRKLSVAQFHWAETDPEATAVVRESTRGYTSLRVGRTLNMTSAKSQLGSPLPRSGRKALTQNDLPMT